MNRATPFGRFVARLLCLLALSAATAGPLRGASPGADSVVAFVPGAGAGFGADSVARTVLGLPHGAGELEGSLHVVSLGSGGTITLYFADNILVDGPGPDFTVFENPFYVGGDSLNRYVEAAMVEVSADGVEYRRFPFDFHPEIEPPGHPDRFEGLAGVEPVYSDRGAPDPTDPAVSGGDPFDLATVGLESARFVRIVDTGRDTRDDDGDLVTDSGLDLPPQAGFDLDAIVHVHWTDATDPFRVTAARAVTEWEIRVDFSKTVSGDPGVAPGDFALDGVALSGADSVSLITGTTAALRLHDPLPGGAGPVLTVSQSIRSTTGENLLDRFDGAVEPPDGIGREGEGRPDAPRPVLSCYPNPFTDRVTVSLDTPAGEVGRVSVYDIRGRRIRRLDGPSGPSPARRLSWDGRDDRGAACPSGLYFVIYESGETILRRRVSIVR